MKRFQFIFYALALIFIYMIVSKQSTRAQTNLVNEYINSDYGFKFNYPQNFTFVDEWDSGVAHIVQFATPEGNKLNVTIQNQELDEQNLEAWVDRQDRDAMVEITSSSYATLGGKPALNQIYATDLGYMFTIYGYDQQKIYTLSLGNLNSNAIPPDLLYILSTFQWLGIVSIRVPELPPIVSERDFSTDLDGTLGQPALQFPFCGHWHITNGYCGQTPGHACDQYNSYGLDWVNEDGATWEAPIYAAHGGNVVAGSHPVNGNYVKIVYDADANYSTWYIHLFSTIGDGSYVQPGDFVGTADCTGACGSTHLHFGLFSGGLTNPTSILPEPMSGVTGFAPYQQHYRDCDSEPPITEISIQGTLGENDWYISSVYMTLTAQDNPGGSGVNSIQYRLDGGSWITYSAPVPVPDGQHTIEYQAVDNGGHWEGIKSFSIKVDTTAPANPTSAAPSCTASSNVWQNTCRDANFTWSGASDATSGLAGYEYDWGPNSGGNPPAVWTTGTSFDPPAISEGSYYLRIRTKDNAGNWSSWQTAFILRYDATAPTGSLLINSDATTSYATLVRLQGAASDAASGINQMRVRDAGGTWYDWQAFLSPMYWLLPATSGQTHTVEIQYRDRAGNLSPVYSDSIFLNVYPDRPSSESYDLLRSTWSASWSGTYPESANYVLKGTFGQPSMVGNMHSSLYVICSGYWSTPCNPTFTYTNFLPLITR
ncbi:MAG TPA: peptidoglycan DD-metalloendopeptidase family protein [Anaerolineales bacterium]|nr:peptidoglycan DD-metalloendopeptidase family protein [Anaerolineales bacterium]